MPYHGRVVPSSLVHFDPVRLHTAPRGQQRDAWYHDGRHDRCRHPSFPSVWPCAALATTSSAGTPTGTSVRMGFLTRSGGRSLPAGEDSDDTRTKDTRLPGYR